MAEMGTGSVKAVVCDPPYGLRFMDKDFDDLGDGALQQKWHVQWLAEARRVLEPGGIIKAFGGTRTFHHLAAAMEEVGFTDIHLDAWAYGSGFPKSHNVAVYMDRMITEGKSRRILRHGVGNLNGKFAEAGKEFVSQSKAHTITTDEAKQWDGWGTALKPAWEPILVGVKPCE
jgi:site-specific DNA-methyltransferase (adenine-specific)